MVDAWNAWTWFDMGELSCASFYAKKSCVIAKTNWTKEDNKEVVRSSHPPLENITFKHRGQDLVASPFKFPSSKEKPVKKVIEHNNYTN